MSDSDDLRYSIESYFASLPEHDVMAVLVTQDGCERTIYLGKMQVRRIPGYYRLPLTEPMRRYLTGEEMLDIAKDWQMKEREYKLHDIRSTPEGGMVAHYREETR